MKLITDDYRLTERELAVIQLTAAGYSAKEAASQLHIAPRTVERHLDNSRMKLRARNRVHLVYKCAEQGFLHASNS
ncbi:response regulator transcription factor [Pelagerythrobacter sp.]|uniref:response regulator transcription factor n=1 Tax=Pelagerythrobacter sp. TaxID=2800702 RepID=UPI0035AE63F0